MSIEKLENWSPRASTAPEPMGLPLSLPAPFGDERSLLFGTGRALFERPPPGLTPGTEGVAGLEAVAAETVG